MCHACENPYCNLAAANPATVIKDFGLTDSMILRLGPEQVANAEANRKLGLLCDKHQANYETVAAVLLAAAEAIKRK